MSDAYLDILKSKLSDQLGIDKFTGGLKKKLAMIRGGAYTKEGFDNVEKGLQSIVDTGATLMRTLRTAGVPESEAIKQVKKYTGQLKDAQMMQTEALYPGYKDAINLELHKSNAVAGIFKDTTTKKPRKATTKISTKKAISDAKRAEKKQRKQKMMQKRQKKKQKKK